MRELKYALTRSCIRSVDAHKKTAGKAGRFEEERKPELPRGPVLNRVNYCAALRGTGRGVRVLFTFAKASNMLWNVGRSM